MKRLGVLIVCLLIHADFAAAADTLCVSGLSNKLKFSDHKNYLLIHNTLSGQQYVYWKKKKQLDVIKIDTNLVKRIYIDFLKDTAACLDYMALLNKAKFKPRIKSLCPYDDSTILACLVTYRMDHLEIQDDDTQQIYEQIPSILQVGINKPVTISFVNETMPIPLHYMGFYLLANKGIIYCTLNPDIEDTLSDLKQLHNLARMKKKGSVYSVDKVMPTVINDYLVTNKVFDNYNKMYFSNGYALMSLSDYIFSLETGGKIQLPIADSVFRNIRIDPKTFVINYYVCDFKYNAAEQMFYLLYDVNSDLYVSSFRAGAKTFQRNDFLYNYTSDFCLALKNTCLSWDGKQILYCMKGENVFRYATVAELQEAARNYKRPPGK